MRVRFPPGPHDAERQSGGNESGGNESEGNESEGNESEGNESEGNESEGRNISKGHPRSGYQLCAFCFVICALKTRSVSLKDETFQKVIRVADTNFVLFALLFVLSRREASASPEQFSQLLC